MRYAGIIKNDISAAPGVCVSFFTQGCPFKCVGCHNPQTWDFNGGKELTDEVVDELINSINANGVSRDLCILGGEPLCDENIPVTQYIIKKVKQVYPNIKIYIWTGYTLEELKLKMDVEYMQEIFKNIDCIIDGRFIFEKRDITLPMRGSSNQKIIYLKEGVPIAD